MKELSIEDQDRIAEEGASALRSYRPDVKEKWRLNPYKPGTDEYDLWNGGYESEAERLGSEGHDW